MSRRPSDDSSGDDVVEHTVTAGGVAIYLIAAALAVIALCMVLGLFVLADFITTLDSAIRVLSELNRNMTGVNP